MRTVVEDYGFLYRAGVLLVVLILGLLLYGLTTWAWHSPAELGAYDMLLRMRPAPIPRDDIAILAIDRDTIAKLGALPWSRAVHARVVRTLRSAGAKFIVYDMLFTEPDTAHPGADRALWRAMTAGRGVFMPMAYDPLRIAEWSAADLRAMISLERYALTDRIIYTEKTPEYRYYYFVLPWADYVSAAEGIGAAVGPTNGTGVVRRAQLAYLAEVKYPVPTRPLPRNIRLPILIDRTVVLQGLPLVVARAVFEVPKQLTQVTFGRDIELLADLEPYVQIPIDESGGMAVNFAGPAESYPHYSAVDLLEGRLDEDTFREKVVLVGPTDAASPFAAMLNTPYGPMPRVEVAANSIGTILDRAYILRDRRVALVTMLLLAIALGLLLPMAGRWTLGPLALMLSLLYIVVAVLILTFLRVALPVIPAVALILLAAVVAALLKPAMFLVGEPTPEVEEQV